LSNKCNISLTEGPIVLF